jgi:hypothetical protein
VSVADQLDLAYRSQRLRLSAVVATAAATTWAERFHDRTAALRQVIDVVTAGQSHTVRLVDAYMTAKALQATGQGTLKGLDPLRYTTDILRGVPAETVYGRAFGAYGAFVKDGAQPADAVRAAQASVTKLAATDLQLAQTRAARDWMLDHDSATAEIRIVGYRRVLTGSGPHCSLCQAASTRTYRVADLMAIHEHCTCTVQPLWGTEPVASVGTTVRIDDDPELGPRLMADDWSPAGPRLRLSNEHEPLSRHVVDVNDALN